MKVKKIIFACFTLVLVTANAMADTPERVVTGDGSLTEIFYALNAENLLAGVDTTSVYPDSATKLPSIGYKRNISVEGVLSLSPDVFLMTEDSGPSKNINQLQKTGLPITIYSAEPTIDAVEEKIIGIGKLIDKEQQAQALWQQVKAKVDSAISKTQLVSTPVKVMFVLGMREKSPIIGGQNTHADSIIKLAGAINAVEDINGYKSITPEAIAHANPDAILMMGREEHTLNPDDIFSKPGFKLTKAAKNKNLIIMDGMYLLGFGPRIGDAIEELSQAIYPELKQE